VPTLPGTSEDEPLRTLVTDEHRSEVLPSSLGQGIAADNELLRLADLKLDPGAGAPAAFVDRSFSFADQTLQTELLSDTEQFIFSASEFTREPGIFRGFFKHLSEEFASGA